MTSILMAMGTLQNTTDVYLSNMAGTMHMDMANIKGSMDTDIVSSMVGLDLVTVDLDMVDGMILEAYSEIDWYSGSFYSKKH